MSHRLEAGDLFCRDSVRFRSFEDDLVDDQRWAKKEVLLAQIGIALLTQPIQNQLNALKCQLEERLRTVNQRISAGKIATCTLPPQENASGGRCSIPRVPSPSTIRSLRRCFR